MFPQKPRNPTLSIRGVTNNKHTSKFIDFPASSFTNIGDLIDLALNQGLAIVPGNYPGSGQKIKVFRHLIILLQETGTTRHSMLHRRWFTINWRHPSAFNEWRKRCVVNGKEDNLIIELHMIFTETLEEEQEWLVLEEHFRQAGDGKISLMEQAFAERIFFEDAPEVTDAIVAGYTTAQVFPEREHVDPEMDGGGCPICQKVINEEKKAAHRGQFVMLPPKKI